jgi:hypothetical protein
MAELIRKQSHIEQPLELLRTTEVDKAIHVVTDVGAHPNPDGWGAIVRQNKQ